MSKQEFFTPTKHMVALDAHLDLIDRLQTENHAKYWTHMLESQRDADAALPPQYEPESGWEHLSEGAIGATHESVRLSYSPTYWVSSEAISLISENVPILPDEVGVHPYDLVTQKGFAYFDRPVEFLDRNDKVCSVKALSWAVTPTAMRAGKMEDGRLGRVPGMVITTYSDLTDYGADEVYSRIADENPSMLQTMLNQYGPLQMFSHVVHPWAIDKGDRNSIQVEFAQDGVHKAHMVKDDMLVDPNLVLMLGDDQMGRWLASFFIVIGQRLVSKVKPTRNIRRRMERREAPDWGEIRVIDLRRYTDAGIVREARKDQPEDWWHNWSHRHRVKAHWARRWVKVEGSDEKALVWRPVKSYIRGPEHLPLVERDDVYRAVR